MSELSPIDNSIIELLKQSRSAQEQEIRDRAKAIHEASREADRILDVNGLLLDECQSLMYSLVQREKYYLDANWFQKQRLKKLGQSALPVTMTVNGRVVVPSRAQERIIRKINVHKRKRFTVDELIPMEAEMTEAGPIKQDWMVTTEPFFVHTFLRTINTEQEELAEITHVHKISMLGDRANVYENGEPLEEVDYYLPLGIVIAANQKVKESLPSRVSKKWEQDRQ